MMAGMIPASVTEMTLERKPMRNMRSRRAWRRGKG